MVKDVEASRITTREGPSWSRRIWVWITYSLTWWIPGFCLRIFGMRRKDIRMAWREKVALFLLILFCCVFVLLFIIVLPRVLCPKVEILSKYEVEGMNALNKAFVSVNGRYFDITDVMSNHINKIGVDKFQVQGILGMDVSQMFYPGKNWDSACPGITNPGATWDNILERDPQKFWPHYTVDSRTNTPSNYLGFLAKYAKGRIGWQPEFLDKWNDPTKKIVIIDDNVYDVAAYFQGQTSPGFFDDNMYKIFTNDLPGKDATPFMRTLKAQDPIYYRNVQNCMNNLFYIGTLDKRNSLRCQVSNIILLAASAIIVATIGFKFLAALRSMHSQNPEEIDKYVIVQVPCYTEGKESLEATINSIAKTDYDDKFKLAVIICDGMITGGGNSKPTPDIALEILFGSEEAVEEAKKTSRENLAYTAIGEGLKVENRGRIYSGLYDYQGHRLPFIVIVKTGNERETYKAGNRGKRDSQILLMRFLQKIYARDTLSELEYELYHHMTESIGVQPEKYEYTLMVDADTAISEDSITKMVSCMISNKRIVGLCGETFVGNEKENLTTMIQVYEYFISHHLAKAFESMFGSVTCLPGCFCMYRIRTKNYTPLLIAPALIDEYADSHVDTLHKKNLLSLGEDRYLTTLILKHHRNYKTMFTPDAECRTNAPSDFWVLVSQRRRWINSTIHNLMELMNLGQLCGFCCLSMRFIVFLDLLSTIVAPASVIYVAYMIYLLIWENTAIPVISLIMIGSIYGLQTIIFILKKKFEHIGWMLLYILAMPIFSFFLPLYAFWHMDEFNWGNTRVVTGEDGKEMEKGEDGEVLEPNAIPRKKIAQWKGERDATDEELLEINEGTHEGFPDIVRYGAQPLPQPQMHITGMNNNGMNNMNNPVMSMPLQYPAPPPTAPMMAYNPYYAPSHVASYVGHEYPPLSHYTGSNWGGSQMDEFDDARTEASFFAGGDLGRRSKRDRKHKKKRKSRKDVLQQENMDGGIVEQMSPDLLDKGKAVEKQKEEVTAQDNWGEWADKFIQTQEKSGEAGPSVVRKTD